MNGVDASQEHQVGWRMGRVMLWLLSSVLAKKFNTALFSQYMGKNIVCVCLYKAGGGEGVPLFSSYPTRGL
jgi:hypothetical protein